MPLHRSGRRLALVIRARIDHRALFQRLQPGQVVQHAALWIRVVVNDGLERRDTPA